MNTDQVRTLVVDIDDHPKMANILVRAHAKLGMPTKNENENIARQDTPVNSLS